MSDCRKRHCPYCGMTPCVGDRCPQWDDDEWDDDDSWDDEPIGSCDECEANLYRDDSYDGLCSQCAWLAQMSLDDEGEDDT